MAKNVRHWEQTTTGRKRIPIAEFEASLKKSEKKKSEE